MKIVKAIVEQLPTSIFKDAVDQLTYDDTSFLSRQEATRFRANIIDQMVETERKYVRDLEIMQVNLNFHDVACVSAKCP